MAYVIKNASIKIDGTDISSFVDSVTLSMVYEDIDATSMGVGGGGRVHLQGLRNDTVSLTAFSSYATLDAVISAKMLSSSSGTVTFEILPNGSTVSAANPKYTGTATLLTYTPVGGAVGEAAKTPLELPVNGTISVATA